MHCSYCLKPTLLTILRTAPASPQCESAHSHTASCGFLPRVGRHQQPANPSVLSMCCMFVKAGLDFPSQGATCKAGNTTVPREQPHLEARLPSARHGDCPYTVHSSETPGKHDSKCPYFRSLSTKYMHNIQESYQKVILLL